MSLFTRFYNLFFPTLFCLSIYSVKAQTNLTAYTNNPVIPYGASGEWDSGIIFLPEVVFENGQYFLFYSGSTDLMTTPLKSGYAVSADGYNWTKFSGNPVFEADGTGFDAFMVAESELIKAGNVWVMYYNGRSAPGPGPGPSIGRATSDSLTGNWTRLEDPVLSAGSSGEWDEAFVSPNSIVTVDSGYFMYYSGGSGYPFPPNDHAMVGLAFSTDGHTWIKYDDPTTTSHPYAESDPVLSLGPAGSYDSGLAWECDVLKTENGFEMFYTGDPDSWTGERICYATSSDGIYWTKHTQNPIFTDMQNWATIDLVSPSAIKINNEYFLYYIGNTTLFNGQIGLATSPVVSVDGESKSGLVKDFQLYQNYPHPFNPSTNIEFRIPNSEWVSINLYDLLGNEIRNLVNELLHPGKYIVQWDGTDNTGLPVASGLYLFRMKAGKYTKTHKMILIY